MIVFTAAVTTKKKVYLLISFAKSNLTQLTTDVMFSGQRFAIIAMFFSFFLL